MTKVCRLFYRLCRLLALAAAAIGICPAAAHAADSSNCIASAKKESIRCWDRCSGTGARLNRCTDQCEDEFESARKSCNRNPAASVNPDRSRLSGTKRAGEDGCYFGECPTDLNRQVRETHAEPDAERPTRRPRRPAREPERDEFVAQAATTNICQTPQFWCVMNQTGPVNQPCWCLSLLTGLVNGITVLQR